MTRRQPPVLALVGPTGAGKSAVALQVAERTGAEIVAVDAFTVYAGMDVGTAKPTPAERARVPHHCMDVRHPSEDCTVGWFQRAARDAIAGVLARGRVPLLVGGSGLYFRAVVDPLEFPPTDARVRREVAERFAGDAAAAHAALRAADPEAAARMEPTNLRRAVRALEVIALTGRRFSDWRRAWDAYRSLYPGLGVVGVDVARPALAARLDARADTMLASGLLDEVARLRADPRGMGRTARQAIGYAEMLAHLDGRCTLAEAVEAMKRRTRRYAARQVRWFAQDPRVQWEDADGAGRALVQTVEARRREATEA